MEELDLGKKLQEFYEKNKHEKKIRNWEETLKKSKGFFNINFLKCKVIGDGINSKDGIILESINIKEKFIFSIKQSYFFYDSYLMFKGRNMNQNLTF